MNEKYFSGNVRGVWSSMRKTGTVGTLYITYIISLCIPVYLFLEDFCCRRHIGNDWPFVTLLMLVFQVVLSWARRWAVTRERPVNYLIPSVHLSFGLALLRLPSMRPCTIIFSMLSPCRLQMCPKYCNLLRSIFWHKVAFSPIWFLTNSFVLCSKIFLASSSNTTSQKLISYSYLPFQPTMFRNHTRQLGKQECA